ncbi:MAG TPA: hypothetical protein VFE79_13615 [Paraburkholderia sp.]|nr:hypothetical protein [Paraburkholderia sp.]
MVLAEKAKKRARKTQRLCLASNSRKNTRLDGADWCTCVAVEGGQMHEDAGIDGFDCKHGPCAAGRLETKKAGVLIAVHFGEMRQETTDEPSCIKTIRFSLTNWRETHCGPA